MTFSHTNQADGHNGIENTLLIKFIVNVLGAKRNNFLFLNFMQIYKLESQSVQQNLWKSKKEK